MDSPANREVANMEGAAALPRRNGELVFGAPWEGRAFGLAVAASDGQLYSWNEFRTYLIDEIAQAEQHGDPSSYYERWLTAFEAVLVEKAILTPAEIEARGREISAG